MMMVAVSFFLGLLLGSIAIYLYFGRENAGLKVEAGKRQAEIDLMRQQIDREAESFNRRLQEQREQYERQTAHQRTLLETQMSQQREQFAEQLKAAQQGMTLAAQKILEHSSEKLKEANAENVGHITTPLKEAISEMRKALDTNSKDAARENASFREVIRQMMDSSREIGEKAESLTNVLRRDNKVTGNMGEIILGDLLAGQGLTEGVHYEVQTRLRDENGRPIKNDETGAEMQPDVILHYPQGQDAIIDSKVSLVAYERYVNAETDEERTRYLQEHIASVRRHVNELARKDYSRYVKAPREAVDFVILFMPFESSLQVALANDATLWREAFEKKVFVTSEQNLVAILHIIHVAWVQNRQAENQQRVFGLAEQLLDRLGDFIKRYNELGERIQRVNKAFDDAGNKLVTGNQSVVKKGRELVSLGAKENPNRRIPEPREELSQ